MRPRFFILGLLYTSVVSGQTNTQLMSADGRIIGDVGDIKAAIINTIRTGNVEGKPYIGEEWNKGTVYFKKGKRADSLLLQFDMVTNKLYFKQEGIIQTFLEEVEGFRFYASGETVPAELWFRNGYPRYAQQQEGTFYQALVQGNVFHLLHFRQMKIAEIYVYNAPPRRQYADASDLFLYNVTTGELVLLKPGKKKILKLLPSYAAKIDALCKQHRWELNSQAELVQLVEALNRELPVVK